MTTYSRIAFGCLLLVTATTQYADAHGFLRRLIMPRQVSCNPQPIACEVIRHEKPMPDTLEGRVTFQGKLPIARPLNLEQMVGGPRERALLQKARDKGILDDAEWRVDSKSLGVANVVVFLKRPKNGVLPIHPQDKIRNDNMTMDAPFLMLEPRVAALYAEWFDGKERGKTGQKLAMKNSSPMPQNRRVDGNPKFNDGWNRILPAMSETELGPPSPQPTALTVVSDIHPWMKGFFFVFDHPYFAVTKADGSFSIPRIPVGMEVQVLAWHERQGWLTGKDGTTILLKPGANTLAFDIKIQ